MGEPEKKRIQRLSEAEILTLLEGTKSTIMEPPKCPHCGSLMTPQLQGNRLVDECVSCEDPMVPR